MTSYAGPGGKSKQSHVALSRRAKVARLRVRGFSYREIANALEAQGEVNPKTGKAWALQTIHADMDAIKTEWKEEAHGLLENHIASVLAEIREVRREAWRQILRDHDGQPLLQNGQRIPAPDLTVILQSLKQERELLGLDAPKDHRFKVELDEAMAEMARATGLDMAEIMAEVDQILSKS